MNVVFVEFSLVGFLNLMVYIEVIQDGMFDLFDDGMLSFVLVIVLLLSLVVVQCFVDEIVMFCEKIVLCLQEISNYLEFVCCFGCIVMNGMIEVDIYGNVNLMYVMGMKIQNGIGGLGDFVCNGYLLCFMLVSIVKGGVILWIVLMVSYVDYIEYDVVVVVIEQGLVDLCGLLLKQCVCKIIVICVYFDYCLMFEDYFECVLCDSFGKYMLYLFVEVLLWYECYVCIGMMKV